MYVTVEVFRDGEEPLLSWRGKVREEFQVEQGSRWSWGEDCAVSLVLQCPSGQYAAHTRGEGGEIGTACGVVLNTSEFSMNRPRI